MLIFELYYPVGFANELGPALYAIHSIGIDRLPSWTQWLLAKLRVRLSRSPVSLSRIAVDASQYAVRPSRLSTLSTRNNVVNRELFAARLLATVLATLLSRLKTFLRLKVTFCVGIASNERQCNDLRDTDTLVNGLNERLIAIEYKSAPVAPVIQLEVDRGVDRALTGSTDKEFVAIVAT